MSPRLALASITLGCALVLTACGGSGDDTASEAAATPSATTEEVTTDEAASEDVSAEEPAVEATADTAAVDAAITEMVSGMALLAMITGSDAEADIATAGAAYERFAVGVESIDQASNVPDDVRTPVFESGWAVLGAIAEFQFALEALVDGTGDADAASAAMDTLAQTTDALNFASDGLTPYTSLTEADLAALYDSAS